MPIKVPKTSKEQRLLDKIERLKTKVKVKKLLPLPRLKEKAQRVFNKWIRERDADLPCISCGKTDAKWHCGHYIPLGSSGVLRYNENNCNKQCNHCNMYKSGNLTEYRISLVKKIGEREVHTLEDLRHELKKWTREELEEIISKYKL